MSDRKYYIAAGRSLAAIERWVEDVKNVRKRRPEFKRKIGADDLVFGRSSFYGNGVIMGVKFKARRPGWRPKSNFFVPDTRSKTGKLVAEEMRGLSEPVPPAEAAPSHFSTGARWFRGGFQKVGDVWLLTVHADCKPPLDAKLIKASEFHLRLEKAEESKKKHKSRKKVKS